MMTLGITGRSGCGKSTVTAVFAGHGLPLADADQISREILLPGSPLLPALAERFGADILKADGTLDRRLLADRAFATPEGKAALALEAEHIVGPAARKGFLPDAHRGPHTDVALPHGKFFLHGQALRPAGHHPFAFDLHCRSPLSGLFWKFLIYNTMDLWYYKGVNLKRATKEISMKERAYPVYTVNKHAEGLLVGGHP